MKKIVIILVACLVSFSAFGQKKGLINIPGIDIGGYVDFSLGDLSTNSSVFDFGDFQLAVSKDLTKSIKIEAAVLFSENSTAGGQSHTFELDVAFFDFHLIKNDGAGSSNDKLAGMGFHILGGKFDVPFGHDYRHYISGERVFASMPVTSSYILEGGVNEVGLQFLYKHPIFSINAMVLKGTGDGVRLGARVQVSPFDSIDSLKKNPDSPFALGASYYYDMSKDTSNLMDEQGFAIDILSFLGAFEIRAEFYMRNVVTGTAFVRDGFTAAIIYHLHKDLNIIPLTFFARFDGARNRTNGAWNIFSNNGDLLTRLTVGASWSFNDVLIVKAEYNHVFTRDSAVAVADYGPNTDSILFNDNSFIMQIVVKY